MKSRNVDEAIVSIPEVPINVSMADLDQDCFLVAKHTREKILADPTLALVNDGRIKRKKLNEYLNESLSPGEPPSRLGYDVIKIDGDYYALYKGVTHGKHKATGSSGVAKSAQNLRTGEWIVPKIISQIHHIDAGQKQHRNADWFEKEKRDAKTEYEINRKMKQNVGKKPLPERTTAKKGRQLIIPMTDAGIDLSDYMILLNKNNIELHPAQIADMMIQIATVLQTFHTEHKLVHRDFKLENLTINPYTGKISLIDFGYAKPLPDSGTLKTKDIVGTPYTIAPETYDRSEYSTRSDAFSLGASMGQFMLMLGPEVPYQASRLLPLDEMLKLKLYDDDTVTWMHRIASRLMNQDPTHRATIASGIEDLKDVQKQIIKPLTIGSIDLAQYRTANQQERDRLIANATHGTHEVVIMNTRDDSDMKDAVELRRTLIEKGIRVNSQLFSGSSLDEIMPRIKAHYTAAQPTLKHILPTNRERLFATQTRFDDLIERLTRTNVIEADAGNHMKILAGISTESDSIWDLFEAAASHINEMDEKADQHRMAHDMAAAETYQRGANDLSQAVITLIEENESLAEEEKIPMINKLREINAQIAQKVAPEPSSSVSSASSASSLSPPRMNVQQSTEISPIDRLIKMIGGLDQLARIKDHIEHQVGIQQGEAERPRQFVKVQHSPEQRLADEVRAAAVESSSAQAPHIVNIDKRLGEFQRALDALNRDDRDNKLRKPRFALRQLLDTLSAKGEMSPQEKQTLLDTELKRIAKQIHKIAPELDPKQGEDIKTYRKKYKKMVTKFERWAKTTGKNASLNELIAQRQAMEAKLNQHYTNYAGMGRLPLFDDKNKSDVTAKRTLGALMQGLNELKRSDLYNKLTDAQLKDITREETIAFNLLRKPRPATDAKPEVLLSNDELETLIKTSAKLAANYTARGRTQNAIRFLNDVQKMIEHQSERRELPVNILLGTIDIQAQIAGIELIKTNAEKRMTTAGQARLHEIINKPPKRKPERNQAAPLVPPRAVPVVEAQAAPVEVSTLPFESLVAAMRALAENTKPEDYRQLKATINQLVADLNDPLISTHEKQQRIEVCYQNILQKKDQMAEDVAITPEEKVSAYKNRLHRLDADLQAHRGGVKNAITLKELINFTADKRANLDREYDVDKINPANLQRRQIAQNAIYSVYTSLQQMATDDFAKIILAVSGPTPADKARVQQLVKLNQQAQLLEKLAAKHTGTAKNDLLSLAGAVRESITQSDPDLAVGLEERTQQIQYIENRFKQLASNSQVAHDPDYTKCKILIRDSLGALQEDFKLHHLSQYQKVIGDQLFEALKIALSGDHVKASALLGKLISSEQLFIENNILNRQTDNVSFNQNAAVLLNHFANVAYVQGYFVDEVKNKIIERDPNSPEIPRFSNQLRNCFALSNTMRDKASQFNDKLPNEEAKSVFRKSVMEGEAGSLKVLDKIRKQAPTIPALKRFGLLADANKAQLPPALPSMRGKSPRRS